MITMKPGDPRWRTYDFINTGDTTLIPMLHVDRWYDTIEIYPTLKLYEYLNGKSPNQYLMVGGAPHCRMAHETEQAMVGERPIGDARFDFPGQVLAWFDHWIKNDGKGPLAMPKVQYYSLNSDRWFAANQWPVKARRLRFYLDSHGDANGLEGHGALQSAPGRGEPDRFDADPANPVPTMGGGCCDPNVARDQRPVEGRKDVLVYSTPPPEHRMRLASYINAMLFFETSVRDTDIAIKLVDVYPDGKAYNIYDSLQRLRYRNGIDSEALVIPGKTYRITLGNLAAATDLPPGHRLRIEIAGIVAHNILHHAGARVLYRASAGPLTGGENAAQACLTEASIV